jgi:hypothetical protein
VDHPTEKRDFAVAKPFFLYPSPSSSFFFYRVCSFYLSIDRSIYDVDPIDSSIITIIITAAMIMIIIIIIWHHKNILSNNDPFVTLSISQSPHQLDASIAHGAPTLHGSQLSGVHPYKRKIFFYFSGMSSTCTSLSLS